LFGSLLVEVGTTHVEVSCGLMDVIAHSLDAQALGKPMCAR
jgi:hypothetical protein